MKFNVLTLFPEMIESCCGCSILKRAVENNIINVKTTNPRDFSLDNTKKSMIRPTGRCWNGFDGTALC